MNERPEGFVVEPVKSPISGKTVKAVYNNLSSGTEIITVCHENSCADYDKGGIQLLGDGDFWAGLKILLREVAENPFSVVGRPYHPWLQDEIYRRIDNLIRLNLGKVDEEGIFHLRNLETPF